MNKIQALEQTIFNLENDVYEYHWGDYESCNCGVLAKTLLDTKRAIRRLVESVKPIRDHNEPYHLFTDRTYCLTTGEELNEVFSALKIAGFTHMELRGLELLNGKEVLDRINRIEPLSKGNKVHAIVYLKAWVEILKEQLPVQPEAPKQKTVYVSVPISITEQSKELILS